MYACTTAATSIRRRGDRHPVELRRGQLLGPPAGRLTVERRRQRRHARRRCCDRSATGGDRRHDRAQLHVRQLADARRPRRRTRRGSSSRRGAPGGTRSRARAAGATSAVGEAARSTSRRPRRERVGSASASIAVAAQLDPLGACPPAPRARRRAPTPAGGPRRDRPARSARSRSRSPDHIRSLGDRTHVPRPAWP